MGCRLAACMNWKRQDKNIDTIIVSIKLNKDYIFPINSIATITTNPLATSSVVIELGRQQNLPGT